MNLFDVLLLPTAPSSAPLLGAGYAHSSSVATFNWTAPLLIDQNGVIEYYNVIVTEVPTGREWSLVAIDSQITMASLHPYYNYSCVVAAFTVEIGPFSQPFFVLTLEEGIYNAYDTPCLLMLCTSLTI